MPVKKSATKRKSVVSIIMGS
ncbi:MAG: hypothetical protein RLZ76_1486, partial [Bacteroidota bacterium]